MADSTYPRDLRGYGARTPDPRWPGGAHVAVQFVVNYEEGGENNILHGDAASEAFLSEIVGAQAWPGQRHMNMELIYEYGARAGFWRLHRLFTDRKVPVTVYGVATALMRSPEQVAAMKAADWEIASHGLKWIEYKDFTEADERQHLREAIRIHTEVTGARPLGWYTGRCSVNTRRLVMEEGGFLYDSDDYSDDLPYWVAGTEGTPSGDPLHPRRQRHALRHAPGLQFRRSVLQLSEGLVRRALCRGQGRRAEDDVRRPALPPRRPAGPRGVIAAFRRLCARAMTRSGCRAASTSRAIGMRISGRLRPREKSSPTPRTTLPPGSRRRRRGPPPGNRCRAPAPAADGARHCGRSSRPGGRWR